jgi:hypothetical protein
VSLDEGKQDGGWRWGCWVSKMVGDDEVVVVVF